MKVSGKIHDSAAFLPRERDPGSYWIGGWVGTRGSLDAVAKTKDTIIRPFRKSNPGRPARSVVFIMTELSRLYITVMHAINSETRGLHVQKINIKASEVREIAKKHFENMFKPLEHRTLFCSYPLHCLNSATLALCHFCISF
jgi:hypothetical protein